MPCLKTAPIVLFLLFIQIFFFLVSARATCQWSATPGELLNRIKKQHPQVLLEDARKNSYKAYKDQAQQVPNPILQMNSVHGENADGVSTYESNASIQYGWELGGKRSARVKAANKRKDYKLQELRNKQEQALIEASLSLVEWAQTNSLLKLYKESIEVFKEMRRSLKETQNLSPENKVQLDIVELEIDNHRLKISQLEQEAIKIRSHLSYFSNTKCETRLVDNSYQLPSLNTSDINVLKTPELLSLELKHKSLMSSFDIERSKAYPDLYIGPSFQREKSPQNTVNRFGLSLTFKLPLLNRNQGGKRLSQSLSLAEEQKVSVTQRKSEAEIKELKETYHVLKKVLDESISRKELVEKHHRIERLFVRGLISVSTMIEGHDQLLKIIEVRNEQERSFLETYFRLKQIEGSLLKDLNIWSRT